MNTPIIVKTKFGIREAILPDQRTFMGYRYTDCTHPMQNSCLPEDYILGWRYVDDTLMNELKFDVNRYERQKEGESILSMVKPKINILQKILASIKSAYS